VFHAVEIVGPFQLAQLPLQGRGRRAQFLVAFVVGAAVRFVTGESSPARPSDSPLVLEQAEGFVENGLLAIAHIRQQE
jgi:hypothetical protein